MAGGEDYTFTDAHESSLRYDFGGRRGIAYSTLTGKRSASEVEKGVWLMLGGWEQPHPCCGDNADAAHAHGASHRQSLAAATAPAEPAGVVQG